MVGVVGRPRKWSVAPPLLGATTDHSTTANHHPNITRPNTQRPLAHAHITARPTLYAEGVLRFLALATVCAAVLAIGWTVTLWCAVRAGDRATPQPPATEDDQ